MRDVNGAVVFISGVLASLGWVRWVLMGEDPYFALQVPLAVAVFLLSVMVIYALANIAQAPEADDFRSIVDTHGANSRLLHGSNCIELKRTAPFVNDLNIEQVNRFLYKT